LSLSVFQASVGRQGQPSTALDAEGGVVMKKICAVVTVVVWSSTGCVSGISDDPSDELVASRTQAVGDETPDEPPECGQNMIAVSPSFDPVGPGGSNFGGCWCSVPGVPEPSIMQRTNPRFPGWVYCEPPVYGCQKFWPVAWTPAIEGQYCMCSGVELPATLKRTNPAFPGWLYCTHTHLGGL
jgi:hypothetical protein